MRNHPCKSLQFSNVSKKFFDGTEERWIIKDLSFVIHFDQATVIRGPSGAGKTTILRLLAGLLVPDNGIISIRLDSSTEPILLNELSIGERLRFRRYHIGYVYQFFNLVPTLTVKENVLLPLSLTKREHLRERALERLTRLGLGGSLDLFPEQLSGGEQQRTAIARAVAHEPPLLLADEPTGNLDSLNSGEVVDLLWGEHQRLDSCLIVASHSDEICNRARHTIQLT